MWGYPVLEFVFPVLCSFGGFPVLTIFLTICSILNLEAAMSMVFAAFLVSNLSLSIGCSSLSGNLQHFGAGSCHFNGLDVYTIVPRRSLIFPLRSLIFTWISLIFLEFRSIFGNTRCANYKL